MAGRFFRLFYRKPSGEWVHAHSVVSLPRAKIVEASMKSRGYEPVKVIEGRMSDAAAYELANSTANPIGGYYFNDGVREVSFATKREAQAAAQKVADKTRKRVIIHGPDTAMRRQRVGTARYRGNPLGTPSQRRKAARTKASRKQSYVKQCAVAIGRVQRDLGRKLTQGERRDYLMDNTDLDSDDIRRIVNDLTHLYIEGDGVSGAKYHTNPDPSNYMMAHRVYAELGYPESKAILLGLAKKVRKEHPKQPQSTKRYTTQQPVYAIKVIIGNRNITEMFDTQEQANSFAKSARKMGFEAHVF